MKSFFSGFILGVAIILWPIRKIDQFIVNALQKIYLAFYDLTGITLGDVQSLIVIATVPFTRGWVDYLCAAFMLFCTQLRALYQRAEKIELINNEANFHCNYLIAFRIIFSVGWLLNFKPEHLLYILFLFSFCLKIRKRDKDRFKKSVPATEGAS